jgi:hypothetical protein
MRTLTVWMLVAFVAAGASCRSEGEGGTASGGGGAPSGAGGIASGAAVRSSAAEPPSAPSPAAAPPAGSVRAAPSSVPPAVAGPVGAASGSPPPAAAVADPGVPGDPAGSTVAPPATAPATASPRTVPQSAPWTVRVTGFAVLPSEATEGEDGRGATVPAVRPVALEVYADSWPGRALDPVLEVGDLVFRRYRHPDVGVLRFVAADADALPAGAPVFVRYEDDASTRVRATPALAVPR